VAVPTTQNTSTARACDQCPPNLSVGPGSALVSQYAALLGARNPHSLESKHSHSHMWRTSMVLLLRLPLCGPGNDGG